MLLKQLMMALDLKHLVGMDVLNHWKKNSAETFDWYCIHILTVEPINMVSNAAGHINLSIVTEWLFLRGSLNKKMTKSALVQAKMKWK